MEDQIEPNKQEERDQASVQLEQIYETKRKELDKIHQDLNELMTRLNTFITEQDDSAMCEESSVDADSQTTTIAKDTEDDDFSEKQDGPQEKELIKQKFQRGFSMEDIYICDGTNPPEIDWDTLAPFIQSVVGDLKQIRQLNQMTNSVMERIRSIAGKNEHCENESIKEIIENEDED
ncbi:uncharacterized protein [Onthophagus taurus]|uniref:uncharacterized protein n=1 Tax=Onthophagus taurus TaxID=166361 RepID=UPI000C209ED2|nr:uncharacterized protein LOC111426309 [Onthophagus taurus]